MMDLKEYMTVTEAARLLGKSIPLISHLCREGRLSNAVKLSTGAWLIPRASVESYTPGKRGPRTKKERMADELSGIRAELKHAKEE
jgi:excisionase family DNA binding protein